MSMPTYLMFIRVLLSVDFSSHLKPTSKGRPFITRAAWSHETPAAIKLVRVRTRLNMHLALERLQPIDVTRTRGRESWYAVTRFLRSKIRFRLELRDNCWANAASMEITIRG